MRYKVKIVQLKTSSRVPFARFHANIRFYVKWKRSSSIFLISSSVGMFYWKKKMKNFKENDFIIHINFLSSLILTIHARKL